MWRKEDGWMRFKVKEGEEKGREGEEKGDG
jgi:hypothetical protein